MLALNQTPETALSCEEDKKIGPDGTEGEPELAVRDLTDLPIGLGRVPTLASRFGRQPALVMMLWAHRFARQPGPTMYWIVPDDYRLGLPIRRVGARFDRGQGLVAAGG